MVYTNGVVHGTIARLAIAAVHILARQAGDHVLGIARVLGIRHRAADLTARSNRVCGPGEEPRELGEQALATIGTGGLLALVVLEPALGELGSVYARITLAVEPAHAVMLRARCLDLMLPPLPAGLVLFAHTVLVGARRRDLVLVAAARRVMLAHARVEVSCGHSLPLSAGAGRVHRALAIVVRACCLGLPIMIVELAHSVFRADTVVECASGKTLPLGGVADGERRALAVVVRARRLGGPLIGSADGV